MATNHPPVFLSLFEHRPRKGWHMEAHAHASQHELICILQGGETVAMRGERIEAGVGDILLFPLGVPHEEWDWRSQGLVSYCLGFAWTDAPPEMPPLLRDENGHVRLMLDLIADERLSPAPTSADTVAGLMEALVNRLLRLWRYPGETIVPTVRQYIRAHIADELTLDRLAESAGLSRYHFVRTYRRLTGRTPMEDVRLLRLEHARALILTTDLPLKSIAPLSGLSDQYHMTRLFRRELGHAPGALRRRPATRRS